MVDEERYCIDILNPGEVCQRRRWTGLRSCSLTITLSIALLMP